MRRGDFSLEIHFEWRLICRRIRRIRMIAINLYVSNIFKQMHALYETNWKLGHFMHNLLLLKRFSVCFQYVRMKNVRRWTHERLNEIQWRHYIQCVHTRCTFETFFREFSTESAANIRLNMIRWSDLVAVVWLVVVVHTSHFKYSLFEWCFEVLAACLLIFFWFHSSVLLDLKTRNIHFVSLFSLAHSK